MTWACVIGKPIEHSLSPVLHQTAYGLLGLDWQYRRFEVDAESLPTFMEDLGSDCIGVSVTMPCKREILKQVDSVESLAKALGVANTVVMQGGLKAAFNTDVRGIEEALRPGLENHPEGSPLIIGNGATACSALAALATLGYRDVHVAARNLAGIGGAFSIAPKLGISAEAIPLKLVDLVAEAASSAPVVISTIPPSASDVLAPLLRPRSDSVLLDVTYSESVQALSEAFLRAGARVASPLSMLVHQGIAQVKLMTDREVPYEPVFKAVQTAARMRR
ncbi:shikimate dehydrogenase [Actinomycetaceae bacterium MB13-C1-2]|nr:shikimate dehydrogenase [Actinomycetaceae bacterium MB13-C1-2]